MPPKRGNSDKADKARADKAKVTKGARDRDEDEDVVEQASPEKSGRKRRKADAATNSGRSEVDDPSQKPARDHKSALIVQVGETVMCRWKDEVRKLRTEPARSAGILGLPDTTAPLRTSRRAHVQIDARFWRHATMTRSKLRSFMSITVAVRLPASCMCAHVVFYVPAPGLACMAR